jgi:hypothetical protein
MSENNTTHILFSYPRSGNTWVRYCVEFFSGRASGTPLNRDRNRRDQPILDTIMGEEKLKNPMILFKTHELPVVAIRLVRNFSDISNFNTENDKFLNFNKDTKMLFLVRNYKDAILSHIKHFFPNSAVSLESETDAYMLHQYFLDGMKSRGKIDPVDIDANDHEDVERSKDDTEKHSNIMLEVYKYSHVMKCYETYDGPKKLIYYEDMIGPKETLKKCLIDVFDWLDVPLDHEELESFITNVSTHMSNSLEVYGKSFTLGSNKNTHKDWMPSNFMKEWDVLMKKDLGKIYEKYLKRYEEKYAFSLQRSK